MNMLTDQDIKKLKEIFVTKIEFRAGIKELSDNLIQGMTDLFNATNERIDKILLKLEDHDDQLNEHDRRIEKLEEKKISN